MPKKLPPIIEPRPTGPGIIDPSRIYGKKRIPDRVVMCFFREVLDELHGRGELSLLHELIGEGPPMPVYTHGRGARRVAVAWSGVGAPYASAVLEELIGLGGRSFIACGGAGALDGQALAAGALFIPTAALRDEGTSYHYGARGRFSRPHVDAVAALRAVCRDADLPYRTGKTWTTDGIFRETAALVRRRRDEGCLTVEMEAAAFFAVARYRKVTFGQLLYAADDVGGETWDHRDWNRLFGTRRTLFDLALAAVRKLP